MASRVTCGQAKKAASQIRKTLRAAINDLKKSQPRAASTKLFRAQQLMAENNKVFRTQKAKALREDAFYVSHKLVNASTMNWPKWKDRAEAMLESFNKISEQLSACR